MYVSLQRASINPDATIKCMNTNNPISFNEVERRLIRLRDQNVLLDFAVADLYGVETKRVNEAVKNNPDKFPEGYVFEVTEAEMNLFAVDYFDRKTLSKTRVAPKAFTEKGLYMLATIVKSPRASKTTVAIIEAFAKMRELSRTIGELAVNPSAPEHESLMHKSGEIMADLFGQDMQTTDVETEIELNFAVLKVKHKVKRKKDVANNN